MSSADIYKSLSGGKQKANVNIDESQTKALLNTLLPISDRGEINEELRKRYLLDQTKKRRGPSKPRDQKTQLSLRERRKLGLYKLPRDGHNFEDYLPLHRLWCDYMRSYLNLDEFRDPSASTDQSTLQLVKADYHGAMVTVTRSRCPSLVGASGILLMDTKNAFKIISKDNKLRTIPKENSMFNITLDGIIFTIFGKHLQIKPVERSTKKFKSKFVCDL